MDLDEAIDNSEVIILAIPVDAMVTLLPGILDKIDNQIVDRPGINKDRID